MIIILAITLYFGSLNQGFRSIHFTVTLARLKKVNRYIKNIVTLYIKGRYIGVPLYIGLNLKSSETLIVINKINQSSPVSYLLCVGHLHSKK